MLNQLKDRLKGKVVIVGIGNILRGDDGAGPELIKRLEFRKFSTLNSKLFLMDVGEVPENYLERIAGYKPDVILLVDVVDFKSSPGSIKVIGQDALRDEGFSTHNVSLKLAMKYLKEETKADVFMLGIQPKKLNPVRGKAPMDSELSGPVKKALNRIEECLIRCMNSA